MKRRSDPIACVAVVALSGLLFTAHAEAPDGRGRPRFERSKPRSPAVSHPGGPIVLPEELRPERYAVPRAPGDAVPEESTTSAAERVGARQRALLTELARREAHRAADLRIERDGRPAYYRVGFHDGLHAALGDPAVGAADRPVGFHDGARDPEARAIGFAMGRDAAAEAAATGARVQVRDQFGNLAVEPRFQPSAHLPRFVPAAVEIEQPGLESVFHDLPLRSFQAIDARHRLYLSAWGLDIHEVYRQQDRAAIYDHAWADAEAACASWLATQSGTRRAMPAAALERQRFEQVFRVEFARRLAARAPDLLTAAFDRGYIDGWAYGAWAHAELHYRRGYVEGFARATDDAARSAFGSEYPVTYEREYASAFVEWRDNPKPEMGRVHLRDGNDDGVFEPGEALQVEMELINYGGAPGRFVVHLDGAVLRNPSRSEFDLPARRSIRVERPPVAFIDERTEPRTQGVVELSLLDTTRRLPLRVAHPFEFERGEVRLTRDDLAGDVRIEVELANHSRHARPAVVTLATSALPGVRRELKLASLGGNGRAVVDLGVEGLPPLGLISGNVTLELHVENGGIVHDRYPVRLPESATDLNSPALLELMIRLARDERASAADIETARELMLLRLEADWRAAVRASGNPYKLDYRRGSSQTALGDLTRTWLDEGSALTRPEVFAGLSDEVMLLAKELPGVHPFLRKYVRKLAGELP